MACALKGELNNGYPYTYQEAQPYVAALCVLKGDEPEIVAARNCLIAYAEGRPAPDLQSTLDTLELAELAEANSELFYNLVLSSFDADGEMVIPYGRSSWHGKRIFHMPRL